MKNFALIETILWENSTFFLLALHLERLKKSAQCFSFPYDESLILQKINDSADVFEKTKKYRVRLVLEKSGKMTIQYQMLEKPPAGPAKAVISKHRINAANIFLYHKTTNRALYNKELKKYRAKGLFEVIFLNQDGQITEGAISNIVIKKNQELWTPPVLCGLLNGTFRQYLLSGVVEARIFAPLQIKEKIFYKEDLLNADAVFMINSVRKILPITLFSSFKSV
ncbi:MAG: aminotransferase class IV [Candidatus Omnitrophota bacterium]